MNFWGHIQTVLLSNVNSGDTILCVIILTLEVRVLFSLGNSLNHAKQVKCPSQKAVSSLCLSSTLSTFNVTFLRDYFMFDKHPSPQLDLETMRTGFMFVSHSIVAPTSGIMSFTYKHQ